MISPLLIGHRGACADLPEHTLSSYFVAIQQGADCIEPDLVSTADGVLIARHEHEIGATTDVAAHPEFAARRTRRLVDGVQRSGWFCEDFSLEELKRLRARERLPQLRPASARFDGQFEIATLEEILGLLESANRERARAAQQRGRAAPAPIGLVAELKHAGYFAGLGLALEPALIEALERAGYRDRDAPVWIESPEPATLRRLRERTRLKLVQLIEPGTASEGLGSARGLDAIAGYAEGISAQKSLIIPRTEDESLGEPTTLVPEAHARGLSVYGWTFRAENRYLPRPQRSGGEPGEPGDLAGELLAYLRTGLDGFFTDQPALAYRARERFLREG